MERRRVPRREPAVDEPLSRVRLRTGRELGVIDVSNGGVCVEGAARLLPGTHLDVHVTTCEGRVLVRSRVVRAYVSALQPDAICYRGALAFDRLVDTSNAAGYGIPSLVPANRLAPGNDYPAADATRATAIEQRLTA
jgi:hypothetical protein